MQKDLMARYNTTIIVNTTVERVARLEGEQTRFEVVDAQGRHWLGRKLVLATGVSDLLPDIPGYESCWVKGMYVMPISTAGNLQTG
jgi:thioredoxin reductase